MRPRACRIAGLTVGLLPAALGATRAQAPAPGAKRALIIAVGEYPAEMGYPRINVSRDVQLLRGTFLHQGFDSSAIEVLRDAAATRDGILGALDRLIARAQEGDAVVVHYSGHGHRISDDNGDELDGYDEILVPWGAPATVRAAGYRGEKHIRDEEFGARLALLRSRVGAPGSVTVMIDACFSGSGTRGSPDEAVARGVSDPIVVAGTRGGPAAASDSGSGWIDRSPSLRAGSSDAAASAGVAPMVVISAARHDQVARETYDEQRRPVGSLSLAASRVFAALSPGSTYRELFERIAATMAGMELGDQRPQVEGAVDARVFSGQLVAQSPFVKVARIVEDTVVELAAGTLIGILPGTRVAVHRSGTADPRAATPTARGTVTQATETRATVALDPGDGRVVAADSRVFVTEQAYGDMRLRMAVDRAIPARTATAIREALSSLSIVDLVESTPDLRVAPAAAGNIALHDPLSGQVSGQALDPGFRGFADAFRESVRAIARAAYLRRLQFSSAALRVRMELVRTEPRIAWDGGQPSCSGSTPRPLVAEAGTEGTVMSPRDEYTLRLINEGSAPAYVAVLDLQPDGRIAQVFPLTQAMGSDNYLLPGRDFVIQDICFYTEESFGTEVLKLFATAERVDFSPLLTGALASARGTANPLERLLGEVAAGTRGAAAVPAGAASTYSLSISVVPRRPARAPR